MAGVLAAIPVALQEYCCIVLGVLAFLLISVNCTIASQRVGPIHPWIGGLLGAAALFFWPAPEVRAWSWMPLILDPVVLLLWRRCNPRLDLSKEEVLKIATGILNGERPDSDLKRYGIRLSLERYELGPERRLSEEEKRALFRELGVDDEDPAAPDHVRAHRNCISNRVLIGKSSSCGCFHCVTIFASSSISKWRESDDTGLCPKCGEDTVLPSESGFPVTVEFLSIMRQYWFNTPRDRATTSKKP